MRIFDVGMNFQMSEILKIKFALIMFKKLMLFKY